MKLFTDWSTGLAALYFFWQHSLIVALVVAIVPSVIVSLLLVHFAHLEKYKQSSFGRYIRQYMTRASEASRFLGYAVMTAGAWYRLIWLILVRLAVILLAWLRGKLLPAA